MFQTRFPATAPNQDTSALVQASVATPLPEDNRGMRLLLKMGWRQNTGLGRLRTGIVEPLQLADASLGYGLGKQEEYDTAATEATRERRKLEVEVEETEEVKKQRQAKHERAEQIKEDVKAMNRPFYCEMCDKQYANVGEWSNHMSSYDHHHTKVRPSIRHRRHMPRPSPAWPPSVSRCRLIIVSHNESINPPPLL